MIPRTKFHPDFPIQSSFQLVKSKPQLGTWDENLFQVSERGLVCVFTVLYPNPFSELTIFQFAPSTKYGIVGDRTLLVREVEGREPYDANMRILCLSRNCLFWGDCSVGMSSRMEASLRLHTSIDHPTSNYFPPSEYSAFPNINRGAAVEIIVAVSASPSCPNKTSWVAPVITSKIATGDEVTSRRTSSGTSSVTPLRRGLLSLTSRHMSGSDGLDGELSKDTFQMHQPKCAGGRNFRRASGQQQQGVLIHSVCMTPHSH